MKNWKQPGARIIVTAPAATASGQGVLVGSLFGIAGAAAASGADVEIDIYGVFTHAKAGTQAWTVGERIYWDNAARVFTNAAAAGANKLVGVSVAAVAGGAGDTTGTVLLTGAFTI